MAAEYADNQKGHMLLSHFDVRHGITLTVTTETRSLGEMRVLKREESNGLNWLRTKRAIHVVDRAFIDGRFWDQRFKLYGSTVITRMKSVLKYSNTMIVLKMIWQAAKLGAKVLLRLSSKHCWGLSLPF